MKKLVGWLFGLLPLLGAVYYFLFAFSKGKNAAAPIQISSRHSDSPLQRDPAPKRKPDVRLPTSTSDNRDISKLQGLELRDAINESMAKVARLSTPEKRRDIADARMRMREPGYRALFASWNLDPADADRVLEIIRTREIERGEALHRHDREGLDGGRKFVDSLETEEAWARSQLVALLEENQLQQLFQLESHMESQALGTVQRIVRP